MFFILGGVHIDTAQNPDKVYVYDSGNSRILGFSSTGSCSVTTAVSCTTNGDCPVGEECLINPFRPADLVFGQDSLEDRGSCNRNNP